MRNGFGGQVPCCRALCGGVHACCTCRLYHRASITRSSLRLVCSYASYGYEDEGGDGRPRAVGQQALMPTATDPKVGGWLLLSSCWEHCCAATAASLSGLLSSL